jgi:ribosomal protein L29
MNGKEVRALRDEEIQVELGRLRSRLFEIRSQTVTEKVEDLSQFTKIRKDIARLLTERTARRHTASGRAEKRAAAKAKAKTTPKAGSPKRAKGPTAKVGTKSTKAKAAKGRGTKKTTKTASTK